MIDAELTFAGDILKSAVIKKGSQQRPLWQRLEKLSPHEMLLWVDRFDSLCAISAEWALAQALESSYNVIVPKRAQFVRSILCEINRLIWLTTYFGRVMQALGQKTLTQHSLILRESIFAAQEELTGGRILPQALALGGVRRDLALGNIQKIHQFVMGWKSSWFSWCELVIGDPLLESRLKGLLPINARLIETLGWWGIVGKACGVNYDSRRHRPYGAYPFIEMDLVSRTAGDGMARLEVAIDEVNLSLSLIEQLLKEIPTDLDTVPEARPLIEQLQPGFFFGTCESAKGPVTACVEVGKQKNVVGVRLFTPGQRVWPVIDRFFSSIRAEDFQLAFASLGVDSEDAEV